VVSNPPAPLPKKTFRDPVVKQKPALFPIAVLFEAVLSAFGRDADPTLVLAGPAVCPEEMPIATLKPPEPDCPAPAPIATLEPPVFRVAAFAPIATESFTVSARAPARVPIKTLLEPVVKDAPACLPMIVLLVPAVTLYRAY
jgi:hypothetical protein